MHRPVASASLILLVLASLPSRADAEPTTIRCTGYDRRVVLSGLKDTSNWGVSYAAFDVTMDVAKGTGLFEAAVVTVNDKNPASLTVAPDRYRLDAETFRAGDTKIFEWVVLDRVDGKLTHYAQVLGQPTEELKRGGSCRKLEVKF